MTDPDTWPSCIGEHAATLAKPRNWNAACARSQYRLGADIGSGGRAILDSINAARGRISADGLADHETHDDGVEMSDVKGGGSASLFGCGGTINTEGDLGLSGEIAC
ncbi:hypothetical protein [Gluconobacter kondonii]|uniref:hypothetical protein n=1 Tax=Gluconobacter kondonii TaxID=941463 RepID=UPI001B8C9ABF|nr:hypothetical protein [Gluconobacter kondonii]MBS1079118.1 hypothetical protein [Gluconobacter kondonii]